MALQVMERDGMAEEKATNRLVRLSNQRSILNTLFYEGPLTSQELTERLKLSHPTVSTIVKGLMQQGLVVRGKTVKTTGGRPPAKLEIAASARCSVGAHVTGGHIRFALVNLGADVVDRRKHTLPLEQTAAYWERFNQLLERFIFDNDVTSDALIGVGMAVQTPVESGPDGIRFPSFVGDEPWRYDLLHGAVKRPVTLNNDAKMASYAQVFGADEHTDVVFLLLSRGVGGAIISNRGLLGAGHKNAEFGHITVEPQGRTCTCGKPGCLSAYCSSGALRTQAGMGLDAFFDLVRQNQPACCAIWDEYLHYLAVGVNDLRMIFDTDVIIGGEMSPYICEYRQQLDTHLARRNPFGEPEDYVRIGEHGEYDAAVGSALLQVEHFMNA